MISSIPYIVHFISGSQLQLKQNALLAAFLAGCFFVGPAVGQEELPEPEPPKIAPASDEAELAMQGFRLTEGLQVELFAAEPNVANPVAFWVSDSGHVYVCETFRQGIGVVDNRDYDDTWVDRDLAAQTIEDRRKYHIELLGDAVNQFTRFDDRIRVLVDDNRDGRADRAKVFADHFNGLLFGTGAGVLEFKGNVYYTCIPNLYLLRDEDGDLQADVRKILYTGFGVRVAFRGHDLHGLTIGPDGRLYFSIGDRGANVPTPAGRLKNVESGSIFRCELDGSDLEIYATGLRNPQELAFDNYGNLFTGDNNSDSGDRARWVYVLEGGDSGWRMAYQYLPDRGPFNRQRLWEPMHEGQPAYIVPPVANIGDGPSGLDYYPGTGFGELFADQFLLADFRGTANKSGIRSIRNVPDGAFFRIAEDGQPIWEILATDVQFGPDGALYISDWVNGWVGEGKGRIYRFTAPDLADQNRIADTRARLAADISSVSAPELRDWLDHVDRRVRLKAQLELAIRGRADLLRQAAEQGSSEPTRLHGLWGLDHCARLHRQTRSVLLEVLRSQAHDDSEQIRAHAVRLIGEAGDHAAARIVREALRDPRPRVQYFALMSIGKLRETGAFEDVLEQIELNAGRDPALRHAGIMALASIASPEQLTALTGASSVHVRLAAVVALRRQHAPQVAAFLHDPDPRVAVEAACAIHDVPLPDAFPELAELVGRPNQPDALVRRALNAAFRLGGEQNAERIARLAADRSQDKAMRLEALQMLSQWQDPQDRDRVLGMWRPIPPRSSDAVIPAVRKIIEPIVAEGDLDLLTELGNVARRLQIREAIPVLVQIADNSDMVPAARAEALRTLAQLDAPQAEPLIRKALASDAEALRTVALELVPWVLPQQADQLLADAALNGSTRQRQTAIAALTTLDHLSDAARRVLQAWAAGSLPPEVHLEARLLAEKFQSDPDVQALLAQIDAQRRPDVRVDAYREALYGGDARRGRDIFFHKVSVSCVRCHKINGQGGEVGPDLSRIGAERPREYLLEAIVDPNRQIAKGFESAIVLDADGVVHTGVVREETDDYLKLIDADGKEIVIPQDEIEARRPTKSAMPEDILKNLSLKEIRDLVEFLATRKGQPHKADAEVL